MVLLKPVLLLNVFIYSICILQFKTMILVKKKKYNIFSLNGSLKRHLVYIFIFIGSLACVLGTSQHFPLHTFYINRAGLPGPLFRVGRWFIYLSTDASTSEAVSDTTKEYVHLYRGRGEEGVASLLKLNLTDPCRTVPCQYHG